MYSIMIVALLFVMQRSWHMTTGFFEAGASLFLYPFIKLQRVIVMPLQKFFHNKEEIENLQKKNSFFARTE